MGNERIRQKWRGYEDMREVDNKEKKRRDERGGQKKQIWDYSMIIFVADNPVNYVLN